VGQSYTSLIQTDRRICSNAYDLVNEGDKAELVWPEFGKPYFQQITKTEDGVKIARMVLSRKPYVADESEALMNLLQGLGTM